LNLSSEKPVSKFPYIKCNLCRCIQEAKYINLSLHYLEQVVIALQERAMGRVGTFHVILKSRHQLMTASDSQYVPCNQSDPREGVQP
jgi:hypothetical protein